MAIAKAFKSLQLKQILSSQENSNSEISLISSEEENSNVKSSIEDNSKEEV